MAAHDGRFESGGTRGQDPLRGGWIGIRGAIHRRTDRFQRAPAGLWPNLDAKYYVLHELGATWAEVTEGTDLLGGVWAREHYHWSEPGLVRLRLVTSIDFRPGTLIDYHVTSRPEGGCHVAVDFQRIATTCA